MTLDLQKTGVYSKLSKTCHQQWNQIILLTTVYHATVFFITGRFIAIKTLNYLRSLPGTE